MYLQRDCHVEFYSYIPSAFFFKLVLFEVLKISFITKQHMFKVYTFLYGSTRVYTHETITTVKKMTVPITLKSFHVCLFNVSSLLPLTIIR